MSGTRLAEADPTVIVVSFFESVVTDRSKSHAVAVGDINDPPHPLHSYTTLLGDPFQGDTH